MVKQAFILTTKGQSVAPQVVQNCRINLVDFKR
jgi:hypothetical protein